jgi:hypothetical protein
MSDQPPGYPQDPQQPAWQPPQQPGGPQQFQYPWQQQPPQTGGPQQFQQGWQQQPQQGYPGGALQPARNKNKGLRIGCFSVLGLFALLIIIGVIASVASSGNGVKKDGSSGSSAVAASRSPAASSQTSAPPGNSLSGPVGTTFTVTDTNDSDATVKYSVTLDKVIQHASPDNSFDTAPTGDHLAGAEFTIKGIVGNDQDDANNDAAAIGNNQQTYQPGFEGLAAGTNFDDGQFNTSAGSSSIGWVTFEVKNGVKVASIQWSPSSGMSGSAPATWTVGG